MWNKNREDAKPNNTVTQRVKPSYAKPSQANPSKTWQGNTTDEANNSKSSPPPNTVQVSSEYGLQSTDWQKYRQRDYTSILARGSVLANLRSHWVGSQYLPLPRPRPHWLGWWGLRWEGSLPQGSHCFLCFLQTYNNAQTKIQVGSSNPQWPGSQ